MRIDAEKLAFRQLNEQVRAAGKIIEIDRCCGQRYIGCGLKDAALTIHGTPGNALGAYLDGASIVVRGNAQDATGDTMNDGRIVIHGHAGDGLGYAMRGGRILVKGNAGYRTGIHMKQYESKKPVIVVGGKVGSFLGEYLAGGLIIVLGIGMDELPVGHFTGTGMHGGSIYIRTRHELIDLPAQVTAAVATDEQKQDIRPWLSDFASHFGVDADTLAADHFWRLSPNAANPYHQLYTAN
ncbi:MAG: glutamate synthase [Eubacteriales bacterium]|nr:glutamate synthase [Eubacteriales bacterium]MDD3866982.1 glutamate synthase [Eubacteriales bacterium]MDD4461837.1 glutamate synthase [Eubacteriales bacterium]